MTSIREAAEDARRKLLAAGINSAALDVRLLLQHSTGLRHEDLIADPDRLISPVAAQELQRIMTRRLTHEPVSRILEAREFYGRSFRVTPAVLDPRPETEILVGAALKLLDPNAHILDLGTGSGAIILTLLAECQKCTGVATDLSAEALSAASNNAVRLGVAGRLRFLHCNWFESVSGMFEVIVSNPPYIPISNIAMLPPEVRSFDPTRALDGGPDGLEAYRRIVAGAGTHLAPGGHILVEIGAGQAETVAPIFTASSFGLKSSIPDLAGHVRCLVFNRV